MAIATAIALGIGAAGLVGGAIQSGEEQRQDLADNILGMEGTLFDLEGALDQTETAILETEAKIGDYESFLEKFPAYEQYQQLLGNFEMSNVVAAATGRKQTGTSAGMMVEGKRQKLASFAGEDLKFGTEGGGLFAQGFQQLVSDLNTQQESAERQLDVYSQSLDILHESRDRYETEIGQYRENLESLYDKPLQSLPIGVPEEALDDWGREEYWNWQNTGKLEFK